VTSGRLMLRQLCKKTASVAEIARGNLELNLEFI